MAALPQHAPFNVSPADFYILPGAEMQALNTYTDVQLIEDGGTPQITSVTDAYEFTSGASTLPLAAHAYFGVAVPDIFTFEASFRADKLPPDFSNMPNLHAFTGVVDQNGCCVGLFFSKVGISYTGSVRFDTLDLLLNSPTQLLPGSLGLVEEGKEYTVRIAVDSDQKVAFIYITETALLALGHQLRFIMPALPTSSSLTNPGDEVIVSVCGTSSLDVTLTLQSAALGTGLLIPNLPPIADPGKDQAIRSCTIARFDGRASFDPEGAPVVYSWRLIDGPDASSFVHTGDDGITTGVVMTDTFYSVFLSALTGAATPAAGDVLLVDGVPYDIIATGGVDITYFVQISGLYLSPGMMGENFRLLKQNALTDRTDAQPSFYPDVPGLFRFDLVVFDGDLYSLPVNMLVNVTDSPIPRGITPDLSFIWGYLSDFWKIVDNTEVIETFWGSLAQIAASELLTLWQHDYGKSLRDIPRTFQRKWLHYDLFFKDPYPDVTVLETIYGSVELGAAPVAGIVEASLPDSFTVSSPLFDAFDLSFNTTAGIISLSDFQAQIQRQLQLVDPRFVVTQPVNTLGTLATLTINAPFPFTCSLRFGVTVYTLGNAPPSGVDGSLVGVNTYVVSRCVSDCGVREGDYLVVDGVAYYILRVTTDASDEWAGRRVITRDPLPITASGTWVIARGASSKFVDYYRTLCSAGDIAVVEVIGTVDQTVQFLEVEVLSAAADNNSRLLLDTFSISEFLSQPTIYSVQLYGVHRRSYYPVEPLVVGVPLLQEFIKNDDDSAVLRQNIDYYLEEYRGQPCLRFVTKANSSVDVWQDELPPAVLWAEVTHIDNRPTIEGNFGIPAQFTLDDLSLLPDTADYLSIVRGLWYAYFNGPTLFNLRAGTQMLLGLPFAETDGVITEIRGDFSSSTGRILITDSSEESIVRSYPYPASLPLEINPDTGVVYAVGDTVKQFAPLVRGVEVTDYIKDPRWFEGYINQGNFYEVEKFFKFLVRIDSSVFSLNTLLFAKTFISRVKPTYTYPQYVVLKALKPTTVDVTDDVAYTGTLHLTERPGVFGPLYYAGGPRGFIGGGLDIPRAAYGGILQAFDSGGQTSGTTGVDRAMDPPVYPTADDIIHWGVDRQCLEPSDVIVGILSGVYGAPFVVAYDGLFQATLPTYQYLYGVFSGTATYIPLSSVSFLPITLGPPVVVAGGGTINVGTLVFRAVYPLPAAVDIIVELWVDGSLESSFPYTLSASTDYSVEITTPNIPIAPGAILEVKIVVDPGGVTTPLPAGGRFFVAFGYGSTPALAAPMAAGTYYSPRLM